MGKSHLPAALLDELRNDEDRRIDKRRWQRTMADARKLCAAAFENAAEIVDGVERQQDIDYGAANTGGAQAAAKALRTYSAKHFGQ